MGLPIFFKPSEPDASSNSTEDPTSRARSTIRGHASILRSTMRNPPPRATTRPHLSSARRRAPTDDVEQHRFFYSSEPHSSVLIAAPPRSSITTTTSDAMRHARRNGSSSPEIPLITFRPSAFTDFVNANDDDDDDDDEDEDDGPPMPAVPESRDFSNPSNVEPSRDSLRRHQQPRRRLMDTRMFRGHTMTLSSLFQPPTIPEQRPRAVPPSRIDASNSNRNNELAERVGETNSQDSSAQRHRRNTEDDVDRRIRRRIQRRVHGGRRIGDTTIRQELVQHPSHHEAAEHRRQFDSHEAQRISDFRLQLRIRERIIASRERMRARLLAEVEQSRRSTTFGRGEQQQNSIEIERADGSITSTPGEWQRVELFDGMLNHLNVEENGQEGTQSNTLLQFGEGGNLRINTNYDGLGDRERSIEFQEPERGHREFDDHYVIDNVEQLDVDDRSDSRHDLDLEGQESWESILITPDPQSPNPSSSFASTAASSSQRPSIGTSVSSMHENASVTIGDCDIVSDVEIDDGAIVAAIEYFGRYTQSRPDPAYVEQPIEQHRAFAGQ
ncbi:hypothetical protein BcDW1_2120 [Botrytis cinerea BcDW1]|uniref:Uncharacterized protein n=1 Tax=Botryotinia fuckeliana (strain BcDW1) TaxID=1290391 RepID=M7U6G7_BOTF1|nr:hypothetical protein BcDW1_2120 [Botrytis cinerea BcDW1]